MSVFQSDDEFYICIGGLLDKIKDDPTVYDKVADSGMVMRFRYVEPDAVITIDAREGVNEISFGEEGSAADVELQMRAELAHRFWMGKLNVMAEVMAGRIGYRGSLGKVMRLLPLIKPAMKLYPDHLRAVGFGHLLEASS